MPRKKLPEHLRRPPGRPDIYPWKTWLDGEQHLVQPRADYDCTDESMRQQIYIRARKEGVRVTVRKAHDGFLVQANRSRRPVGTTQKYDWDLLLDGQTHSLQVGKDITSKLSNFRAYARLQATERGLRLITRTIGPTLVIRAVPRTDNTPAATLEVPGMRLTARGWEQP